MNLIDKVIGTVREASKLMVHNGFEIEQKGDCSNIVTSSDIAVQNFLCKELSEILPGSGFFCEEKDIHDLDKEYVWIIDPIDGTTNYARGIDSCCISVALKHGNEIILGVVYSPAREELYCAEKGKGASLNGKPIHVSSRTFQNGLFFTAMSTYRKEFAPVCNHIIMETFCQCNDLRRFGSCAMELCFMAAGLGELYFEIRLQPWDYAASTLILEEAGGCCCNLEGRMPRMDGPDLLVAANNSRNLEKLHGIVCKHIDTIPYKD